MNSVYKVEAGQIDTDALFQLAKANSNIDYDDQDGLLRLLFDAAIQEAENYTGLYLFHRPAVISLSEWPDDHVFDVGPVTGITEIRYKDIGDADQIMPVDDYQLVEWFNANYQKLDFLVGSLPETGYNHKYPVTISATVGYTLESLPNAIKSAILLRFSYKEMHREDAPEKGLRSFHAALRPYKRW